MIPQKDEASSSAHSQVTEISVLKWVLDVVLRRVDAFFPVSHFVVSTGETHLNILLSFLRRVIAPVSLSFLAGVLG